MEKYRPLTPREERRFWGYVDQSNPDSCWPWLRSRLARGYGRYMRRAYDELAVIVLAHITAYELIFGPVPAGMLVVHTCGNPACCNPTHLELKTRQEVMRAARVRKGSAHQGAKLTESAARDIRIAHQDGIGYRKLATRYGVAPITIMRLLKGETWRHVV